MLAERRVDKGIRGLTVGALLLVGCESSNTQPVVVPTESPLPAAAEITKLVSPEIKAIFDEVYAKHGVTIKSYSNPNVYEEAKIIASTLEKIPSAGYLLNGDIGINKDDKFYEKGRIGAWPFFDLDRGGFALIVGYEFDPDSKEGAENQIGRETQGELLEWIIVHEAGHMFTNRVQYNPSFFSVNHPVHKTFAQLAGYEIRTRSFKRNETQSEDVPIWSMALPAKSFVRVGHVGNIEETFADYFAMSILYPELMSEKERSYFDIIHSGLRGNPESFVEDIRRNPQLLRR